MGLLSVLLTTFISLPAYAEEGSDGEVYDSFTEFCSLDLTNILDEAEVVLTDEVYTTGNGGLTLWLEEGSQVVSGGGSNTVYMEGAGSISFGGSNIIYASSGAQVDNLGGSNLIFLQNGATFDSTGSGGNTIYYENYADIIDAGAGATLYKCGDMEFLVPEKPSDEDDDSGKDSEDDLDDSDEDDDSGEDSDDDLDDSDEDEDDDSGKDSEDDLDDSDDLEDIVEDIFEEEGDEVEGQEGDETTVVVEEIDEDDLNEDMEEALDEATESGDYPNKFYLSVQWGYFPAEGEAAPEMDLTTWDGTILFGAREDLIVARPYKMLRFEKGTDSIDFEATSERETIFDSTIANHHDGILFKVKTDLEGANDYGIENIPSVTFVSEHFPDGVRVSLSDLLEYGEYVQHVGDYDIVFNVWTHDDWLDESSEHRGENSGHEHSDVEQGSWYEQYKDFSVENGFFEGYKGEDGKLNGKIGPGDSLTRFQLLKVMYELSVKLEMGAATSACDPDTVFLYDTTVWMGEDHWARGYVECIEQSGLNITLLESTIAESQIKGDMPAYRIEVIATAFEMLDLDTTGTEDSDLSDVHDGEVVAAFADMIDAAVELGVIEGYPDGSFKPMRTVNRAEMFKIVTLFYEVLSL